MSPSTSILYTSIVQPILLYHSTCFFNMLTVKKRNRLTQITNTATKIIVLHTPNLQELNTKAITRITHAVSLDITHPLNLHFSLLPSGRRYRNIRCNKVLSPSISHPITQQSKTSRIMYATMYVSPCTPMIYDGMCDNCL